MMQNTHNSPDTPASAGAFIRWAGSKRSLVPDLMARAPEKFGHYFEPFVGAGHLFWSLANAGRLEPGEVTLSDNCLPLVRTWRGLREDEDEVIRLLESYPLSSKWFYRLRSIHPDRLTGDPELAAWFLYMNRTCFNGLYRVNRQGKFNVPWGRWEVIGRGPKPVDADAFRAVSRVMSKLEVSLEHRSFEYVLSDSKKGDFVYFDPPYLPTSKTSDFTSYTPGGFRYDDHVKLRDLALELKKLGVHVMVSNADVPRIRELYDADFQVDVVHAARSINSKGSGRGKVAEIIAR